VPRLGFEEVRGLGGCGECVSASKFSDLRENTGNFLEIELYGDI